MAGESEEGRVFGVPAEEVHPDGEILVVPVERHRHRGVACDVGNDAGVCDRRAAGFQRTERRVVGGEHLAQRQRRRRHRRIQEHIPL